ncbi:hypothetical protein PVAP13_8KG228405 [Panicum virgatum]|uniref:Secreted protein n=1 Tax=Panicum virgatum TaxID=38727 RepID=A0A8T0PKD1_PANVG|nr:hypothetical protein PVAP13_8KG228405 [Panicum virgatum]
MLLRLLHAALVPVPTGSSTAATHGLCCSCSCSYAPPHPCHRGPCMPPSRQPLPLSLCLLMVRASSSATAADRAATHTPADLLRVRFRCAHDW